MMPARPAAPAAAVLGALDHWATTTPAAPAVRPIAPDGAPGPAWTYQHLAHTVEALAHRLAALAPPDSTIILRAPNSPDYVAWFLAALAAGIRIAPVHPQSTPHELRALAARTAAAAHIADSPVIDALPFLPVALASEPAAPTASSLRSLAANGSVILQSSGATGLPKLVRRGEQSLDADARNVAEAASLTPGDRILAAVPLSHSYGVDLLVAAILAGASLHTLDAFDPAALQRLLAHADGPTVFPGVPFMFAALAREAGAPRPRCLRAAFSAGTQLPPSVFDAARSAWGLSLGQLYGASELGSVTLGLPGHADFDPLSVGTPLRDVSIRILDPADPTRQLPPGAEGHLAVRAPSMLDEYLGEPVPAADGHFLTGDLARLDPLGHVYITGRLKHLIDVGGLKVNPLEVEAAFAAHPAIAECALAPLHLSDTVTRLRLIYVPRPGASPSPADLRAFGRERLAPYKLPRAFDAAARLPRSPSGKLLRPLLADL